MQSIRNIDKQIISNSNEIVNNIDELIKVLKLIYYKIVK